MDAPIAVRQSGHLIELEAQNITAAIRLGMVELTSYCSAVQTAVAGPPEDDQAERKREGNTVVDLDARLMVCGKWEDHPLSKLFRFHGINARWDDKLKAYLRGRRKWLRRHMLEYRQEQDPETDKVYKQGTTVEVEYRRVLEKYEEEIAKRPWSNGMMDFQLEDTARALMKDRAYIGHKQGMGKSYQYGGIIDTLNQQRIRSLAGQGKVPTKPYALIICESKAVWDLRDMLKELCALDPKIIEKRGDENDSNPVHIVALEKISYGRDKWVEAGCPVCRAKDGLPLMTENEGLCRKCHNPIRTAVPAFPCLCTITKLTNEKVNYRHVKRICFNCHRPYLYQIYWADREAEIKMLTSGEHADPFEHRVLAVNSTEDQDDKNLRAFPAGLIWRRHPWAKKLRKRYSTIIIDESFTIQNPDAIRTKSMMQLVPKRRRYIGTGTLCDGVVVDAYSQFGWCFGFDNPLMPFKHYEDTKYRDTFCEWSERPKTTDVDKKTRVLINKTAPADLKKWFSFFFPKAIRRTDNPQNQEQMRLLPPDHRLVEVLMDDVDRLHYGYFLDVFSREFAEMQQEAAITGERISQMAVQSKMWALRAATSCPQSDRVTGVRPYSRDICSKQKMLVTLVEKYVAMGDRVIVFSGMPDGCEIAANILAAKGFMSHVLTGKQNLRERQRRIDEWKATRDIPLLICSINAERTARTFTQANHCIFIDMEWSPLSIEQAWKRIHRKGQLKQVSIDYICCFGTIDSIIYDEVLRKQASTNLAIDRRNETDYVHSRIDALEIALKVMAQAELFKDELRKIREEYFGAVEGQPMDGMLFREIRKDDII